MDLREMYSFHCVNDNMNKCTFWHLRLTTTEISLRIGAALISLHCPHEETLHFWLPQMRPGKILIRLRECAGLIWIFAGRICPKVLFWNYGSIHSIK